MKSNIRIKFITIISLVLALFIINITIATNDKKVSNSINYDENSDKKSTTLISTFYDDKDLEEYWRLKEIVQGDEFKKTVGSLTKYNNSEKINEFNLYKNNNIEEVVKEETKEEMKNDIKDDTNVKNTENTENYIVYDKETIIKNAEEKIEEIIGEDIRFLGDNPQDGCITDEVWDKLNELGISNGYFWTPNEISMIKVIVYDEETEKLVFLNEGAAILVEDNEFTDITKLFFENSRDNYIEQFKNYCMNNKYNKKQGE